jgi:hypothetical protein
MKSEKLTVLQYAKKRAVTPQAITKAIRAKKDLPGVTKVELIGKTYLLTVKKEIV